MTGRQTTVQHAVLHAMLLGTWLFAAASPADAASCPDFRRLAEAALPSQIGNRLAMAKLLSPTVAQPQLPDFLADRSNLRRSLRVLGDGALTADRRECSVGGRARKAAADPSAWPLGAAQCTVRSRKTSNAAQLQLGIGEITVVMSAQSATVAHGIVGASGDAAVIHTTVSTARQWGVPPGEIRVTSGAMLIERSTGPSIDGAIQESAPIRVTAGRHIGGVPVLGSMLEADLDSAGRLARAHIRWPRFCITDGLAQGMESRMMTRQEVIERVVEALSTVNGCGTLSLLAANVVYARASADAPCYVPALAVQALPLTGKDGEPTTTMTPAQVVPLLRDDPTQG